MDKIIIGSNGYNAYLAQKNQTQKPREKQINAHGDTFERTSPLPKDQQSFLDTQTKILEAKKRRNIQSPQIKSTTYPMPTPTPVITSVKAPVLNGVNVPVIKQIEQTESISETPEVKSQKSVIKNAAQPTQERDIIGYDLGGIEARDYIRTRLLDRYGLLDEAYQVKPLDSKNPQVSQLPTDCKYASLGTARFNNKTQEYIHVCENLKLVADKNGVRGKTPLSGKQGINWRLNNIKEAGINTIIDLRAPECLSKFAQSAMEEKGIKYVNFPVDDRNWTTESLDKITEYINAVNEGDYYVGCANGESRTDIAVTVNYLCNAKAKNAPELFFGSDATTRGTVIENMRKISSLVSRNHEITKDWGWKDYNEFREVMPKRLNKLLATIGKK